MDDKTQEEIKTAKKTFMPVNKEKSIRLKVDENGNEYYDMSPKDPEYFKKYYHRHKPVPTPYPHLKKTDIDPTYYDKYYVKRYHKQKENEFTCEFCGTQLKSGKHHQARHYKTKFCMNVKKLIADKLSLIEQKDCVLSPEEKIYKLYY